MTVSDSDLGTYNNNELGYLGRHHADKSVWEIAMQQRVLGASGVEVLRLVYGCMRLAGSDRSHGKRTPRNGPWSEVPGRL